MLHLRAATDPRWAERAVAHVDEILLDHAHLEKKAAGTAVTLLFRHPEIEALQRPLAALAREELAHFEGVLAHLARRGQAFRRQKPGRYAGRLHRIARSDARHHLLDTLLVAAVIEARSCERLGLLADALGPVDAELADYYRSLLASEARHHGEYVQLAELCHPAAAVRERLAEVAAHEAAIVTEAAFEPRLHG
jgi:tRNA 2-(methylsulfanyl)-N6-isopentenyladenosine37 hydroxylase